MMSEYKKEKLRNRIIELVNMSAAKCQYNFFEHEKALKEDPHMLVGDGMAIINRFDISDEENELGTIEATLKRNDLICGEYSILIRVLTDAIRYDYVLSRETNGKKLKGDFTPTNFMISKKGLTILNKDMETVFIKITEDTFFTWWIEEDDETGEVTESFSWDEGETEIKLNACYF